jgi:hypothetical protein
MVSNGALYARVQDVRIGSYIDKEAMEQLERVFVRMDTGMLQEVLWIIEDLILCRRKKCLTKGGRCERSITYGRQELSAVDSVDGESEKKGRKTGKG